MGSRSYADLGGPNEVVRNSAIVLIEDVYV